MIKILMLIVIISNRCNAAPAHIATVWNSDVVGRKIGLVIVRSKKFEDAVKAQGPNSKIAELQGPEWDALEDARNQIFQDKSIYGDCATVQLLYDCPSFATLEDISCSLTSRGKKILPILEYAKSHRVFGIDPAGQKCWDSEIDTIVVAILKGQEIGCSQ